jgi:hypothetical protein
MRSFLALLAFASCSHIPLSAGALNDVDRVAFIARITDQAGPVSTVFRDDSSYRGKLSARKIADNEADRRLAAVLADGTFEKSKSGERELKFRTLTRFEIAEGIRSQILSQLPREQPWKSAASPSEVARVLESFLVKEVPANEPDYDRLKELGADTVMEIVIEEYGMRSDSGQAGVFLKGFARMFKIGGGQMYFRSFVSDELSSHIAGQDPFLVAKNASLFVDRLRTIMNAISETVAKDLIGSNKENADTALVAKPVKRDSKTSEVGPKQFEEKKEEVDPL